MNTAKIRKTTSYIMAVPMKDMDINTPQMIYDRINDLDEFELENISFDDKNVCPMLTVVYNGLEYIVDVKVETLQIDPDYIFCHPMPDECIRTLKKAKIGLTVSITFSDDIINSYFFQIKLLNCILPDKAAVIDFNTHRILSPMWIESATRSSAAPGPGYMFSINVIGGNGDKVWIHTHGLNRCGFVELEVLDCVKENVNTYASILSITSNKIISENDMPDEMKPMNIASLENSQNLSVTWCLWKDVINDYADNIPGVGTSRTREHCFFNGILYIYPLVKKNKKPCKATDVHNINLENAIIEIASSETERMRIIAVETIPQLTKGFSIPGAKAIVKIEIDASENNNNPVNYEHIWAELNEIGIDDITCSSIQNSVFSDTLRQDDKIRSKITNITDWVLNINGKRISPDCAFLVDNIN